MSEKFPCVLKYIYAKIKRLFDNLSFFSFLFFLLFLLLLSVVFYVTMCVTRSSPLFFFVGNYFLCNHLSLVGPCNLNAFQYKYVGFPIRSRWDLYFQHLSVWTFNVGKSLKSKKKGGRSLNIKSIWHIILPSICREVDAFSLF